MVLSIISLLAAYYQGLWEAERRGVRAVEQFRTAHFLAKDYPSTDQCPSGYPIKKNIGERLENLLYLLKKWCPKVNIPQ